MTISIEVPKEFEEHFNMDRFKDSLERVRVDIQKGFVNNNIILSGLYEIELIEMLRDAMIKADVIKER